MTASHEVTAPDSATKFRTSRASQKWESLRKETEKVASVTTDHESSDDDTSSRASKASIIECN